MKYEYLIFDLDGTISDPKDGIVKCLNHALSSHSFPIQDEEELSTYIGPPLDSTLKWSTNFGHKLRGDFHTSPPLQQA